MFVNYYTHQSDTGFYSGHIDAYMWSVRIDCHNLTDCFWIVPGTLDGE